MVNIREIAFRPLRPSDLPLMNKLMREGTGYWRYEKEALDRFMSSHRVDDASYFEDAFGFIVGDSRGIIGYYSFKIEEKPVCWIYFFWMLRGSEKGMGVFFGNIALLKPRRKVGQNSSFGLTLILNPSMSSWERL